MVSEPSSDWRTFGKDAVVTGKVPYDLPDFVIDAVETTPFSAASTLEPPPPHPFSFSSSGIGYVC